MLVENPKYQTIKEIKEQYSGYCVCIVNFKGKPSRIHGGEVIAYGDSVAELMDDTEHLPPHKGRIFTSYKSFGVNVFSSVTAHVVSHED